MRLKNKLMGPLAAAAVFALPVWAAAASASASSLERLQQEEAAHFLKGGSLPQAAAAPVERIFADDGRSPDNTARGTRVALLANAPGDATAEDDRANDEPRATQVAATSAARDTYAFAARDATEPLPAGTWTATLHGGGLTDSQLKEGTFNVQAGVGYLVTDQVEVGLRQSLQFADFGESNWAGSTRLHGDYHFDFDRWQPFAGLNLSFTYGDSVADTWAAGPEVGVKYFLKDEAFIFAMIQYDIFFRDASNERDNFDDGQILYAVGPGFTF